LEKDYRKKILRHYNRAAGIYDIDEFIRKGTRAKIIGFSDIQPGERVLDICTGTGELALAFARVGARVTAIDLAKRMLYRAADKTGNFLINWLNMDATRLGFSENTFHVSTVSLALHHMPERIQLKVLSELAHVTRHKVIIVEPHQPYNEKIHRLWAFIASIIDESEFMSQWVRQDLNQTCTNAGLEVEFTEVCTLAVHRITLCRPSTV